MTEPLSGSPPAAVTKADDILLWLVNHVGKFPRSPRCVLGERIETRMLTVLELLVRAAYAREKHAHLVQANAEVQVLRLLVRVGKDLGFTSLKPYAFISRELVERVELDRGAVGRWGRRATGAGGSDPTPSPERRAEP